MRATLIFTTREAQPKEFAFEHFRALTKYGYGLMMVYDPWRNVSLARNYGALLALRHSPEVLVFMDDDATFSLEFLRAVISEARPNSPVNLSSSLCFVIYASDFLKVKGFDPRYRPMFQEDIDLFIRCERLGMKITQLPTPLGWVHYADTKRRASKTLRNEWNSTFTWIRHRVTPHAKETNSPPLGSPWRFLKHLFMFLLFPKRARFMFVHLPAFFYWLILRQIRKDGDYIQATREKLKVTGLVGVRLA